MRLNGERNLRGKLCSGMRRYGYKKRTEGKDDWRLRFPVQGYNNMNRIQIKTDGNVATYSDIDNSTKLTRQTV